MTFPSEHGDGMRNNPQNDLQRLGNPPRTPRQIDYKCALAYAGATARKKRPVRLLVTLEPYQLRDPGRPSVDDLLRRFGSHIPGPEPRTPCRQHKIYSQGIRVMKKPGDDLLPVITDHRVVTDIKDRLV